jgi:hypothetical protein
MYEYYSLYYIRKKCVIVTGIRVTLFEKRQTRIEANVAHHEGPKKP